MINYGQLSANEAGPPHNWAGTFIFGDSGDLWRHHGEGIGLSPASSRFGHICARFNITIQ